MGKYLITGGAGFIGSNLAEKLKKDGQEVAVIDDLSTGKKDYIPSGVSFYEVDIADKAKVEEVFKEEFGKQRIDAVFHLAAQIDVRVSVEDPRSDNKINVWGGLNVLENCQKFGVDKIVFTSTGGALYDSDDEIPTTEKQIPKPISPYGIHKLTFEHYLNYYHQVFGQKYIALRLANVYGPRQFKGGEAGVITIFIDNAVRGKRSVLYGDGKQTRDFVYVDDVLNALERASSADFVGCLNIGRGVETDIWEVIENIEFATGEKMDMIQEEARAGEVRRSCLNPSLAERILGWEPRVDLAKGIKQTIQWSRGNI
jgi:UDP-glucose 4-epimerase